MLSPESNPVACIKKFAEHICAKLVTAEIKTWAQKNGLMPVYTAPGQRLGYSSTYR